MEIKTGYAVAEAQSQSSLDSALAHLHSLIDVPKLVAAIKSHQELQAASAKNTPEAAAVEPQTWFTIKQLAQAERAFTEPALRNLVFKASPRYSTKGEIPGNGLIEAGAIKRVGGKVLIHHARFLAWIEQQGSKGRAS